MTRQSKNTERISPEFSEFNTRDLIRPLRNNSKSNRHSSNNKSKHSNLNRHKRYHHKSKRGWFNRLFWRLVILICVISALPMIVLRYYNPPSSSFIELNKRNGNTNIKHDWLDMQDISLYFPLAVLASEDQQFPNHFGFDVKQILLVLEERENGLSRGASTLTQQIVKNLFLWPERSLTRKGIEAWLVLWMELIVPKKRILELYVNFAQFGKSIFGIGAASKYYFGISADQLNPEQSALIAASLPTPSRSNPAKPSNYLKSRARFIIDQMPRIGGRQLIRDL